MTYSKPELMLLGNAAELIQKTGEKTAGDFDPLPVDPAYDLDE